MHKLLLIIVVLKIAGLVLATNNSYVIFAPKIFRPGMTANMTVLILKEHPPGTPVDVQAMFLINSIPIGSASGQFRAGSIGSLQLEIPFQGFPRESNKYNTQKQLRVIGSGGLTFNTTKTYGVFFNTKGFSIYVQTDKGVYKPGQKDDLHLPHGLQVFVKDHDCHDHIVKLYYACECEPCCIQCGEYLHGVEEDEDIYPQCEGCEDPPVKKRVISS